MPQKLIGSTHKKTWRLILLNFLKIIGEVGLRLRCEGLGLRATALVLQANKRTITKWEADKKEALMLYAFCHNFIYLTFEGDELYTTISRRTDPGDSEGWTAVIMDRASRFIVDQRCGKKNGDLFRSVMKIVCRFVKRT